MQFTFSLQETALEKLLEEIEQEIVEAKEGAVREAANLAVKEGRANIAAAGFSSRWQKGLTSKFYPNKGGDPAALIYHRIGLAGVFETGMTIMGRPLLWLPIDENLPASFRSKFGSQRTPKKYGRKLVSVNIAGKPPLLFDAQDRSRGPLFFAVRSATIRKRFDLYRIFAQVADQMREFYEKRIKG